MSASIVLNAVLDHIQVRQNWILEELKGPITDEELTKMTARNEELSLLIKAITPYLPPHKGVKEND